ncbi:aminoglycoside 6'-N-acetyltransferase [Leptolyngbya sp. AN02str]|uniref:aminoglycoside 6'-N-acetyltransferase n=1 Tax=Leptolyngbya sp. AN02str TaxID=3423363 RepID=UPI003D31F92F
MHIRLVAVGDRPEWLRMRSQLWPSSGVDELATEIDKFLAQPLHPATTLMAAFVVDRGDGRLGGFVEVSVRNYAEGCTSDRVGYIEGWYVDADLRRQGWGAALIQAAETWAKQLGLTEMASDCELDNTVSLEAHQALGYCEVERVICFRKAL